MEKAVLQKHLLDGDSLRKIASQEQVSLGTVRYWLKQHGLKAANERFLEWDIEKLREIAPVALSKRDILVQMGRRDTGSIYTTLDAVAAKHGIALPQTPNRKEIAKRNRRRGSERLREDTELKGSTLRRILEEDLGWAYVCKKCGLSEWLGEPLTLEVDHINGDHRDNRVTNLRFLCPNCHSQTPTHSRRK